jgi:ribulose kinase
MSQQAIVPVLRTVRSCDRCKLKKIRCNNAIPCDQCLVHGTQCTYNLPNRRKRYTLNAAAVTAIQNTNESNADPAQLKIRNLEQQLNNYKLQIQALEKSLIQYLSPVRFNFKNKKSNPLFDFANYDPLPSH